MLVSFKPIVFKGTEINKKNQEEEPVDDFTEIPSNQKRSQSWKKGFLAGTISGMIMAGSVVDCYHTSRSEDLLQDLKENLESSDLYKVYVDTFNNGTSGIILEKSYGTRDIYDIKSHDIYRKYGGTLIEDDDW